MSRYKQPWSLWAIASHMGCTSSCETGELFALQAAVVCQFFVNPEAAEDTSLLKLKTGSAQGRLFCTFWNQQTHADTVRQHADSISFGQHRLQMGCLWISHDLSVGLHLLYVVYNCILDEWAVSSCSAATKCVSHEQPLFGGWSWLAAANLDKPAKLLKCLDLGI